MPSRERAAVNAVHRMQRAAVLDAFLAASAKFWERRARQFDWARPRPSDYPGRATAEQIRDQDARLLTIATACRNRATVGDELLPHERRAFDEAADAA